MRQFCYIPTKYKGSLVGTDNIIQASIKSVSQILGDALINEIATRNWFGIPHAWKIAHFRDM